ncbi:hypothetical protein [Actinomycetospora aeridis]|uniref:Uncharacterized protein n=1 Tax=Actinomycetospora aeridis TaxID=3129231 RepID=A0ABU8MYM7_9PSEU
MFEVELGRLDSHRLCLELREAISMGTAQAIMEGAGWAEGVRDGRLADVRRHLPDTLLELAQGLSNPDVDLLQSLARALRTPSDGHGLVGPTTQLLYSSDEWEQSTHEGNPGRSHRLLEQIRSDALEVIDRVLGFLRETPSPSSADYRAGVRAYAEVLDRVPWSTVAATMGARGAGPKLHRLLTEFSDDDLVESLEAAKSGLTELRSELSTAASQETTKIWERVSVALRVGFTVVVGGGVGAALAGAATGESPLKEFVKVVVATLVAEVTNETIRMRGRGPGPSRMGTTHARLVGALEECRAEDPVDMLDQLRVQTKLSAAIYAARIDSLRVGWPDSHDRAEYWLTLDRLHPEVHGGPTPPDQVNNVLRDLRSFDQRVGDTRAAPSGRDWSPSPL